LVLTRNLKPDRDTRRPTQRDVARVAGVSQATVSRFFSEQGYVASETVELIREAAGALSYEVDPLARSLVKGESDIYALVIGTLTNPFYPFALERLTSKIRSQGREVLLFNAAREQDLDALLPVVLKYRVRGVLILTADLSSRLALELDRRNIPAVLFNRYNRVGTVHSVVCDNVEGGRRVADEFLNAGHRKIGYLGGTTGTSTNHDRRKGLVDRLSERGMDPLFTIEREFTHGWGWEAAASIARDHPDTEAVFCGDDAIAMGLMDGLRELDLLRDRAPFSIVGFDDIPSAAWPAYALSTIRQPVDKMIDLALTVLEDGTAEKKINLLSGDLIRRKSF
jgi:DNA-binding LacI/PurR family transcriptional regulator